MSIVATLAYMILTGAASGTFRLETGPLAMDIGPSGVTRLTNRLTGETLAVRRPELPAGMALHRVGETGAWKPENAVRGQSNRGAVQIRMTRSHDRLTTRFLALPGGDVEVRQYAAGAPAGMYGASWTLGVVPDRCEVLVPGNSGLRFGKDAPGSVRHFDYPLGWEAGFVLIQGARGGLLIQANDPAMTPKRLTIQPVSGGFEISLMSQAEAPFEQRDRLAGKPWLIRAYRGPWQVGARLYRSWAEKNLGLKPLSLLDGPGAAQRTPRWAADIRFVATVGMNIETIRALARRVIPRRTLLYIPAWRRDGYDRNYPDYTPAPAFGPFVEAAHRLGFRVMPHVNYFGCDPKNPEYARFRQYHMRDPFSKELLWWDWKRADPPIKFAYINPASREWRKLFVERMTRLCRQYNIDALHLDQTLCIFNDANGRIDGMSCAEGNLALHRELKRALPNVALSGEGLNEVTCRFEEFAQRHVWGLNHVDGTWDDRLLAMAHPVASAVLAPNTTMYGYLGLPNPDHAPQLADAWQRAYERFGVIPTFSWPDAAQLAKGASLEIERLLRRGGVFLRHGFGPDFRPHWGANDLFVWRNHAGARLRYLRSNGTAFELREQGKPPIVLERRIEDAERIGGSGSIPSWPAYNEREILGLNPTRRYTWMPDPRDHRKLHLSSLPSGWHVSRSGMHADLFRIGLSAHSGNAAYELQLWDDRAVTLQGQSKGQHEHEAVRCGIVVPGSRSPSARGLDLVDEPSGGIVQVDGEGLFFHPPYKMPPDGTRNRTDLMSFVEYRITLPDAHGLRFRAGAHLRTGAETSDGVRFRVAAWPQGRSGDRQTAEVIATGVRPVPIELALDSFRGRSIVLRIEADAGPAGDPTYDWGRLAKPMISADPEHVPPVEATLTFVGAPQPQRVLTASGIPDLQRQSDGSLRLRTVLPNVIIIPRGDAVPVPPEGLDLMTLPLRTCTRSETGFEGPPSPYGPGKEAAKCSGVERPAISLHPPRQGCSLLDYDLLLPDTPTKLVTAIGIRDGSKSGGVGFRVEVNGKVLFSRDTLPGSAWIPVEVDMAAYRGREVMLTLVTDALGDFSFDWAVWAEPKLVPAH